MSQVQRPGTWRTYLELATGVGDTSRKQVRKVVKDLVGKGNATAGQLKAMTGELLAVSTVNREALAKLVKLEVDRALGRVGLATMDEVKELTARVHELERQLREARTEPTVPARATPGKPTPAKAAPAKATTATVTTARATTAKASSPVVKKATRKAVKATVAAPAKASRTARGAAR